MSQAELGLLPSGHLHWFSTAENDDAGQLVEHTAEQKSIVDTFAQDIAAGMIALAAKDSAADLSPALAYWRAFTCRYLAERCRMVQIEPSRPDPVDAFDEQQIAQQAQTSGANAGGAEPGGITEIIRHRTGNVNTEMILSRWKLARLL